MLQPDNGVIGQLARAYSVLVVLGILTLILLYAGLPFFGPVNDLINAAAAIVVLLLAWRLHTAVAAEKGGLATLLLLCAGLGALLIAGNSVLVAMGRMDWQTGGIYTALGYGFFGLWLLGALPAITGALGLPAGLLTLGRWAAATMAVGLLAVLPLLSLVRIDSPLAYAAMLAMLAGWLLFPWWTYKLSQFLA